MKIGRLFTKIVSNMKRNSSAQIGTRSKMQKNSISVMTNPESSKSDKKQYRLIKLENSLKALLIHHELEDAKIDEESKADLGDDHHHHVRKLSESSEQTDTDDSDEEEEEEPEREKLAAVALCIGAGSFQDYENKIEGLAHFVGKINYN